MYETHTLQAPIVCVGLTVRTTNADEMTAGQKDSRAKIGNLWERFYAGFSNQLNENTQVFGLYHTYESDVNGAFNVTAGIANAPSLKELTDEETTEVIIPVGNYVVFRKQGDMPQAVIDAWMDVWNYFSSDDCQHTRTYDVDFEKNIDMNTVEVWIGVEAI